MNHRITFTKARNVVGMVVGIYLLACLILIGITAVVYHTIHH